MTDSFKLEDEHPPERRMLKDLHSKRHTILEGFRKVLDENGMDGVDISTFGLRLKSGAPLCPNGRPANFKCVLTATGEYECKWVCD